MCSKDFKIIIKEKDIKARRLIHKPSLAFKSKVKYNRKLKHKDKNYD
jgi:hypothetical protein